MKDRAFKEASAETRYGFRNLVAWQKAQELVMSVIMISKQLPRDRATDVIVQQLLRSSMAISANIAEGHGRFSAGAYRNHLSIARGSTAETITWLDMLERGGYVTPAELQPVFTLCDEIMRLLSKHMIDLDKRTGTDRTLRDESVEYVIE